MNKESKVIKSTKYTNQLRFKKSKNNILFLILILFLIGTIIRFSVMTIRPFHHDEAVFSQYFVNDVILKGHLFQYDPTYHGPIIFYVTALIFKIFGDNVFTARLVQTTLSSLLILIYFLFIKKYTKYKASAIISTAYVTLSPILIYYGSFAFDESYFLFFWLTSLIFLLNYFYTNDKKSKKINLFLFTLFTSILFCIKELIYFIVFIESIIFLYLYFIKKYQDVINPKNNIKSEENNNVIMKVKNKKRKNISLILLSLFAKDIKRNIDFIIENILIFLTIIFIFFSNFFQDIKWNPFYTIIIAISDSFKLSHASPQDKPFLYYTSYLLFYATPIILTIFIFFSIAYIIRYIIKLIKSKKIDLNDHVKFSVILFALLLYFIISSISYKTNWNVVYIALPIFLTIPIFFDSTFNFIKKIKNGLTIKKRNQSKIILKTKNKANNFNKNRLMTKLAILFLLILMIATFTYESYIFYISNIKYPAKSIRNHLSYVQATEDYRKMMRIIKIENQTLKSKFRVVFLNSDNWPGYWYFRKYKNVYFYNNVKQFLEFNKNKNDSNYHSPIYIILYTYLKNFKEKINQLKNYSNMTFNLRDQGDIKVYLFIKK